MKINELKAKRRRYKQRVRNLTIGGVVGVIFLIIMINVITHQSSNSVNGTRTTADGGTEVGTGDVVQSTALFDIVDTNTEDGSEGSTSISDLVDDSEAEPADSGLSAADGAVLSEAESTSESTTSETTIAEGDKLVCLTFDDGPGVYTDKILDLLEEYNSKATFFMIGEQVKSYATAVKREHDMGMQQGNHSWDHKTLTKLTGDEIREELVKTRDVIEEVTGDQPTVYRQPEGAYNDEVWDNDLDVPCIHWNLDTLDWKTRDADTSYNTVMDNVKDGDIILMHEIYEESYQAALRIVPALIERGFKLVTIDEMAKAKGHYPLRANHPYGSF